MHLTRCAVLLAAAALFAVPMPARAGGPTSVLITDPSTGRASGLHYGQPAYGELERLLQEGEPLPTPGRDLGGSSYTLTWMVHDVTPWRVQFVRPDARGGPIVGTQAMNHDGQIEEDLTWLRLDDGTAVTQLLEATLSFAGPPRRAPEPTVVERVVYEQTTDWFSLAGWRWVLPGALAGLLLGGLAGRRRDDDPRRTLTDVAQPVGVTGSPG